MRKRYSFSSRRTKHIENINKQRQKYPVLMGKILQDSDILLEVLDARFVFETRNFEFEKDIKKQGKEIIYVLNKSDLVKKDRIKLSESIAVSCKKRAGIKELRDKIKIIAKKIKEPVDKTGRVTVGVVGYPNTGKSSLINLLIGKNSAKTGSEAGFTKGIQKLKLSSEILLLDSPGVIPKKEYSSVKFRKISEHTKVGARSFSQVKNPEGIIANLMKEYPGVFEDYYKIKAEGDSEIFLEKLGRQKNFLKKAGEVNFDKTSRFVLKDWQAGVIGVL